MPSKGPFDVNANATSSTTVVVVWGDIPLQDQNGLIEGFKVCYAAVQPLPRPEHKKVNLNTSGCMLTQANMPDLA